MAKLESEIEHDFVELCKGRFVTVKMTPDGEDGWPDRQIFFGGGRSAFIEFKRPGEKPRPLQRRRMKTLEELGHRCSVQYDAKKALRWVEYIEKHPR